MHKFKIMAPMKITENNEQMPYFECGKEDRRHTTLNRCWALNDTQTVREYFGEPRSKLTDDTATYQVELY